MPLYEIGSGGLIPFRRIPGGPDLYENEIEELVWANPEEILGESLLVVARQQTLPSGGRVDVIGLTEDARVVVVEVKRDVDRAQLAQSLEYAGWARQTSLDEISGMYHRGQAEFFQDWLDFTGSTHPPVINLKPKLILVARDFEGRTESALDFLMDSRLPVRVIRVAIYEDLQGRRFLDIEGDYEPELLAGGDTGVEVDITRVNGRRIRVADLLEAGLLRAGDALTWDRPRLGVKYRANVQENGAIRLEDGRELASPSVAAMRAADIPAFDGWLAWRVDRLEGKLLNDLRRELVEKPSAVSVGGERHARHLQTEPRATSEGRHHLAGEELHGAHRVQAAHARDVHPADDLGRAEL